MSGKSIGMRFLGIVSRMMMFTLAIVQLFDFIFTSIAIQDFLGTGKTFIWGPKEAYAHIIKAPSPSNTYCQDNELYHYKNAITKWGSLILKEMAVNTSDFLWGSVGYFKPDEASDPEHETDMCRYFKGEYYHIHPTKNRLMTSKEKLTLLKPMSLYSHEDEITTLADLDEKLEDGYVGARRAIEIRMTARLDFPEWMDEIRRAEELKRKENSAVNYKDLNITTTKLVKAMRFYGKSFCDGCKPIAELGQMFCQLEVFVEKGDNKTDMHIEVLEAKKRPGSKHRMGVAFAASQTSTVEAILRVLTLFYTVHVVLNILMNSCKSNEERYHVYKRQGATAAILHSDLVNRPFMSEFLKPEQNIARATPFSLSFFLYNSDIIVFLNVAVVIMTFFQSMQLKNEVVWWAKHDETFRSVITRIGVNAKMMWIYLFFIKLYKYSVIRFFRKPEWAIKMAFHSHVFVWFFVGYLFFLALIGFDFLLEPFFHDYFDIINKFSLINDVTVTFDEGLYFIRIPWVFLHTILISGLALTILIVTHNFFKIGMPNNSLYRTMACCQSTIIWDPELFTPDESKKAALVPVTTLMNLKWFLKTQCLQFADEKVYQDLPTDYTPQCTPEERAIMEESVCRVMVTSDRILHITMNSTKGDVEHMAQFHMWLQRNRTLIVV